MLVRYSRTAYLMTSQTGILDKLTGIMLCRPFEGRSRTGIIKRLFGVTLLLVIIHPFPDDLLITLHKLHFHFEDYKRMLLNQTVSV